MNEKKKSILGLLAILMIVAAIGVVATVGIGPTKTGAAENIKLGLDLAGGVSITYEVAEEEFSDTAIADTVYKLQLRVQSYSTEADVYKEGSRRINVEIPGVSDANAVLEDLGRPGALEFYDSAMGLVMTGSDVEDAQPVAQQNPTTGMREYVVALTLTEEGAAKFADATTKAAVNQDVIYIMYDSMIISSPAVQVPITGGQCTITGMPDFDTASELATTIRIGSLPLELVEVRSNVVGARLGIEAIETSLLAGLIGFLLVVIFMIAAYRLSGLASGIALTMYVGLILGCLNAFDLTLTLPGMAGIVLSIGMAVDANVIIFARIKEELAQERTVRSAIKVGFKKAMSAIVDGNITTLIAAVVLMLKGSGPIKGFAQTLMLGIILSMFTALVICRILMICFYHLGFQDVKYYGIQKERKVIDFVKYKKICFSISAVIIIAGLAFLGVNQSRFGSILNYSIEFAGGTSMNITFEKDYTLQEFNDDVVPVIIEATGDLAPQIQKVEGTTAYVVKTKELNQETRQALNQVLLDTFGVEESSITAETISPSISSEMKTDAIVSVLIASVLILLYIWFRFSDIKFAASAVTALLHDVLIVFAFYVISRTAVGNTFIACMLTIVGYSINSTIVIFDRIRENMAEKSKADLVYLVNQSITQTLTRSIYTTLTTFIMVFVLFILGVASMREFSLPLMVGIVSGAYASVCITGSLWLVLKGVGKKRVASN